MLYVRGSSKDYDEWEALGNPGWGYDHVLKYFKRSEKFHNPFKRSFKESGIDIGHHKDGEDGRLWVMPTETVPNIQNLFADAAKDIGYKYGDYNGEMQDKEVIFHAQVTSPNCTLALPALCHFFDPATSPRRW